MKRNILFLLIALPFIGTAQIDNSVINLMKDKASLYIDSSILYATDVNKKNRAGQEQGVWTIKGSGSKPFNSVTSYYNGRLHGHTIVFYPDNKIATSSYDYFNVPHGPFIAF